MIMMNAWMHKLLRQGREHILHIRILISSLLLCKVLQGRFVECQPSIQKKYVASKALDPRGCSFLRC